MGVADRESNMDTSEFTDEQIEALQALADGYNDQSVSRRDVMKLVGTGGVGALLGGGGMASATEPASAGTAQSGQLGTAADPVDVEAEDVNAKTANVDETHTKTIGANGYHYAGDYDGADVDARFDAALLNASDGDLIYAEKGTYTAAHTISNRVSVIGSAHRDPGPRFEGDLTLDIDNISLQGVQTVTNTISVNGEGAIIRFINGFSNTINVNADKVQLIGIKGNSASATFTSGTTGGIVDASTNVTVTDNGTNTVGDIA